MKQALVHYWSTTAHVSKRISLTSHLKKTFHIWKTLQWILWRGSNLVMNVFWLWQWLGHGPGKQLSYVITSLFTGVYAFLGKTPWSWHQRRHIMQRMIILFTTWWRHQMETFSALLAICAGNSPVPGEFPALRPMTQSFDVFFDLRLNERLSKNREAGDLRRYRAHYDVAVMIKGIMYCWLETLINIYYHSVTMLSCLLSVDFHG